MNTIQRKRNNGLTLIILGVIVLGIIAAVILSRQANKSLKAASSSYSLLLYPTSETMSVGESKVFELRAVFSNNLAGERLDYLRSELSFSATNLEAPTNVYIDTSMSGFQKIFRVDGPNQINASGKIVIELGANTPGTGPATSGPITIARITLKGKGVTTSALPITIGVSQLVNNQSAVLPMTGSQNASYTVTSGTVPTITPVPLPTGNATAQCIGTTIEAAGYSGPVQGGRLTLPLNAVFTIKTTIDGVDHLPTDWNSLGFYNMDNLYSVNNPKPAYPYPLPAGYTAAAPTPPETLTVVSLTNALVSSVTSTRKTYTWNLNTSDLFKADRNNNDTAINHIQMNAYAGGYPVDNMAQCVVWVVKSTTIPTPTKVPNGGSCTIGSECVSGLCSNGVCVASLPTPTPMPTSISCKRGELGNLDCSSDGCIDTADFELFRQGYGHLANSLSIPSNHHTPDLIVDSSGYVDTADYNILFQNFGTCSP